MQPKISEKKKIIIVNNNMKIGGVQKALLDLLYEISSHYDVTLCLLHKTGEYLRRVPKDVEVIGCNSLYKYFGMSQAESKKKVKDFILRSSLAFITKLFGRGVATKLISAFSKKLTGKYDCAISYMHDGGAHLLYGGCNSFVISKVNAKNKITFLHCDYENCGSNCKSNNVIYNKFNFIAACSEGCRRSFLRVLPHLESKTKTVINCHNFGEIIRLSNEDTIVYDGKNVNAVIVARLSPEKGIDRALHALKYVLDRGVKVNLHIVGQGISMEPLNVLCKELQIESNVVFYGGQTNPYRYMKNADFLFIPSYHEAAPLVIDEALCLGVPILATETTSSDDMILKRNCGWVCENTQSGINSKLYELVSNPEKICEKKKAIAASVICNNNQAVDMLKKIID